MADKAEEMRKMMGRISQAPRGFTCRLVLIIYRMFQNKIYLMHTILKRMQGAKFANTESPIIICSLALFHIFI